MVHIRRLGSVVLIASILLGVSCNKKTPTLEALTRGERLVNSRLAEYTTVSELSSFVGTRPRRCVDFSRDVKLCEWRINNHLDSWSSLAKPIGTRDQINLLCVVPSSAASRHTKSCSAYPRRSNRDQYQLPGPGSLRHNEGSESRVEMRERQTLEAQKALDSARDLVALSDLVGTAPTECKSFNDSVQICTWYADRATYGHGTLARSINAGLHKKVTLVCELPDNGEARPENSCTVSIGD